MRGLVVLQLTSTIPNDEIHVPVLVVVGKRGLAVRANGEGVERVAVRLELDELSVAVFEVPAAAILFWRRGQE